MSSDKQEKLKQAIKDKKITDEKTAATFVMVEEMKEEVEQKVAEVENKIIESEEKIDKKVSEAIKQVKESEVNLDKVLESVKGKDGKDGKDGEMGLQGFKGEKGDKGKDGKDGKDGHNGKDGKDGETPDISKIVLEAKNKALNELLPKIPTLEQLEQRLPVEGEFYRDALELLKEDDRLALTAIKGLDDYPEVSRLAKLSKNGFIGGGSIARNFYQLFDVPQSYSGQSGKVVKVKTTEDGLEFGTGGGSSVSFGTTTQIPYMNVGGTDFIYSSKFTFDGNKLKAGEGLFSNGGGANNQIYIGSVSASDTYPGIWLGANATTPSYTNYTLLGSSSDMAFNAPSGSVLSFKIANNTQFTINSAGGTFVNATYSFGYQSTQLANTTLLVTTGENAAYRALVLRGHTAQSANIFEIRDVSNNLLSIFDNNGYGFIRDYVFDLGLATPITTGNNKTNGLIVSRAGKIVKAFAYCKTAPTGADLIVDINLNGNTIWSTQANRLKIVATQTSGNQTSFNTTALAEGDILTIDVDQVGSTIPGQDITIVLLCELKNQ
jgi:hypothetical protein